MIYDVDYTEFGKNFIPPKRRTEDHVAWVKALLTPVQQVRDLIFDVYRPDVIERMRYNGQTIILEAILNKVFEIPPPPYPQIIIDNIDNNIENVYIYNIAEEKALFIYNEAENQPIYLYNEAEYEVEFDFIVYVPNIAPEFFFNNIEKQVRAEVEKYKIAGVNYDVQPYV